MGPINSPRVAAYERMVEEMNGTNNPGPGPLPPPRPAARPAVTHMSKGDHQTRMWGAVLFAVIVTLFVGYFLFGGSSSTPRAPSALRGDVIAPASLKGGEEMLPGLGEPALKRAPPPAAVAPLPAPAAKCGARPRHIPEDALLDEDTCTWMYKVR
ncbi:MAG: hypothetical protein AAB421_04805 [Patescibacteria group bacterium]